MSLYNLLFMTMLRSIVLSLLVFVSVSAVEAQSDDTGWNLVREAEGIQLFSRPQGEGMVDDIKGVLTVTGNLDSAFKVLSHIPTLCSTDPVVTQTEILETVSANEYYIWQLAKMPFFMNDRDVVAKISFSQTSKGGYMLASQTYPDYIPEKPRLTRLKDIAVVVSLRPLSPTTFELMYKMHIGDVYGSIVTNATNKAALESTLERLKRMRDLTAARPLADK